MRWVVLLLAAVALMGVGATSTVQCSLPDVVVVAPPLRVVTVQYVNDADADVLTSLLYMSDDDKDKDDLQEDGRQIDTLTPKGETKQIVLDCDEAGSLAIDRAKLLLIGDIGPTADTDDLHIDHDYGCGDTITFTYYNSPDLTSLHIQSDVR